MSAASTPIPTKYIAGRPRYSLFWPLLIFLLGVGTLSFYQVVSLQDRYDEVVNNINRLDPQVQKAIYEKTKFYTIARDILRLSDKNPNAKQIALQFKLPQLRNAQPELMSMSTPPGVLPPAPEQGNSGNFQSPATTKTDSAPINK